MDGNYSILDITDQYNSFKDNHIYHQHTSCRKLVSVGRLCRFLVESYEYQSLQLIKDPPWNIPLFWRRIWSSYCNQVFREIFQAINFKVLFSTKGSTCPLGSTKASEIVAKVEAPLNTGLECGCTKFYQFNLERIRSLPMPLSLLLKELVLSARKRGNHIGDPSFLQLCWRVSVPWLRESGLWAIKEWSWLHAL